MTSNIGARKLKDFGTGSWFWNCSTKSNKKDANAKVLLKMHLKKSIRA